MLRATLEMVPFGDEEKKYTIGVVQIANISKLGQPVANYEINYVGDMGQRDTVVLKRFDRAKGAWTLLKRSLSKLKF